MALENALLWLMIAAMLLRAAVYGALYFTLPRDARRVKENRAPPKPRDPEAELTGRFLSHLQNMHMFIAGEWPIQRATHAHLLPGPVACGGGICKDQVHADSSL